MYSFCMWLHTYEGAYMAHAWMQDKLCILFVCDCIHMRVHTWHTIECKINYVFCLYMIAYTWGCIHGARVNARRKTVDPVGSDYLCMNACACMQLYIYIYIYIYRHTHTYILYIYICIVNIYICAQCNWYKIIKHPCILSERVVCVLTCCVCAHTYFIYIYIYIYIILWLLILGCLPIYVLYIYTCILPVQT